MVARTADPLAPASLTYSWQSVLYRGFAEAGILRAYRRNSFIFMQGEPATAAFAIKTGRVEMLSTSESGREVAISMRSPGEIFGTNETVLRIDRTRGARTLEDSELWVLPDDVFFELLHNQPEFSMAMLRSALHRGIQQVEMKANLIGTSARHRVMASLCYLSERPSRTRREQLAVTIRITHEQLSRLCGLRRQTVTSELSRLEAEGLLLLQSGAIVVHDPSQFQRVCDSED